MPLHPFFPEPTEKQREALEIAGSYLERAANQAATRMLSALPKNANSVVFSDLQEGMDRSAKLCQMVVEIFDGWPSEFATGD